MKRNNLLSIATFLLILSSLTSAFDIRDFGAVANDTSLGAEQKNAQALMDAIVAANTTTTVDERVVLVPANLTFNTMPVWAANVTNVVFQIDGTLRLSKRHHLIPERKLGKLYDFFYLTDIDTITFQGSGEVDGQGYMWWVRELIGQNHNGRPHLVRIRRARNISFSGIRWINSPSFHFEI